MTKSKNTKLAVDVSRSKHFKIEVEDVGLTTFPTIFFYLLFYLFIYLFLFLFYLFIFFFFGGGVLILNIG